MIIPAPLSQAFKNIWFLFLGSNNSDLWHLRQISFKVLGTGVIFKQVFFFCFLKMVGFLYLSISLSNQDSWHIDDLSNLLRSVNTCEMFHFNGVIAKLRLRFKILHLRVEHWSIYTPKFLFDIFVKYFYF